MKERVFIGIPAFQGIQPESAPDYMRFAYYLGRFYPEYQFFLGVVQKLEQFRARNELVTGALQTGCKYLLMLDDDHIIDVQDRAVPSESYEFLRTLIGHMEANPKIGLVGALYWQRGAACHPVLMKQGTDGKYYWLREDEIERQLQPVAVAGGGCMLIRCEVFDKIENPWFRPELEKGTDFQIAEAIRAAGWEVWADTSIELGHIVQKREILTERNRPKFVEASTQFKSQVDQDWNISGMMLLFNGDVEEYLGLTSQQVRELADQYQQKTFRDYQDPRDFYRNLGNEQLARQYLFHNQPGYGTGAYLNKLIALANGDSRRILDYGCGSAPIGFEMLMQGHKVDFIDLDGAPGFEFLKWRVKKRHKEDDAGFGRLAGGYDFIMMMDSLEHLPNAPEVLQDLAGRLKEGGYFLTNFFALMDYANPEHIFMDKKAARKILLDANIYPKDQATWQKQSI